MEAPSRHEPEPSARPHEHHVLRRSLRTVTVAWGFGAAWMYITTGAVLTRYAQSLQMSEFGFGLLAALPFAGLLVQVPASYMLERYGKRKWLFLTAGLIHRGLWLAIAAIPWLPGAEAGDGWWLLLVILTASTALANVTGLTWTTWMADLVPSRIRGRYFSRRGQVGRFVGMGTTIAIGFALDRASAIDAATLQRLLSLALAIAALCGMMDIGLFKWVPDARPHVEVRQFNFLKMLGQPLRDPSFRRFIAFNFTLTFAIAYVGQFAWLYLFDVVGMSNMRANMMLVAIPLIVSMLSFPVWGRMVDRMGCRPVLIVSGLFITHGAVSWVFVTKEQWWIGYMAVLSATMAWPGVELANQKLLLGMIGTDKAGKGSAYVAVHSAAIGIAGLLSGVFAGSLAETLSRVDWRGSIFGWPLTYHGLLFVISAGLRLAALVFLIGMAEPTAYTARAAIRYMAANIYSNLQQAVFGSIRGVVRISRLRL